MTLVRCRPVPVPGFPGDPGSLAAGDTERPGDLGRPDADRGRLDNVGSSQTLGSGSLKR